MSEQGFEVAQPMDQESIRKSIARKQAQEDKQKASEEEAGPVPTNVG